MATVPLQRGILTIPEFAAEFGISVKTAWKMRADGRLSVLKIGRSIRIERSELDRIAEEARIPSCRPIREF